MKKQKLKNKEYKNLSIYNSLLYLKDDFVYNSFLKYTNNCKIIKVKFNAKKYEVSVMLYEPFIV